MRHAILGRSGDRGKLERWFKRSRRQFRYLNVLGVALLSLSLWVATLITLFLLLAYRPTLDTAPDDALFAYTGGIHFYTVGSAPARAVVMENRYAAHDFTEYLARTAGLVPAACTVSDRTVRIPYVPTGSGEVADAADGGTGVARSVPPDTTLAPGLLGFWMGEDTREMLGGCQWRGEPSSILAVVSPVGAVQKLTLFLMILGLVLVRKGALQIRMDAVCFPGRSRARAWKESQIQDIEMIVHPVLTPPDGDSEMLPLYPTKPISLDGASAAREEVVTYRNNVYSTRLAMGENQLRQPFDLILNVLDSGVKHRRVGPMTDRIASAIFDFRERIGNRFWFVDYILWFLPTIGFLGTIYGISVSLVRAKGLFDEENEFSQVIRQVVDGLGVAFDTTSMALICSAILYFFLRRTEAKIGPLVDRAEETLTELLVGAVVDTAATAPTETEGENQDILVEENAAEVEEVEEADAPADVSGEAAGGEPRSGE
ncbi:MULTISPECIES: MotA/TolQ/ExbB proton channel family protein [unclassified Ruegeria]|uniref:MotA/TolQ/ExbB proton channel family protein n=1 Tax=unclassified Ruegeria TaxID=2625375 RepID=UPI0014880592|nr:MULTISPECIES: MotA/TolQ/ExbB proton channel family protein [unclassified Ruegeria]NOD85939.1 hypothetical protein [Ruegeria sp. HKCCD6119]